MPSFDLYHLCLYLGQSRIFPGLQKIPLDSALPVAVAVRRLSVCAVRLFSVHGD